MCIWQVYSTGLLNQWLVMFNSALFILIERVLDTITNHYRSKGGSLIQNRQQSNIDKQFWYGSNYNNILYNTNNTNIILYSQNMSF